MKRVGHQEMASFPRIVVERNRLFNHRLRLGIGERVARLFVIEDQAEVFHFILLKGWMPSFME
jgi:hypothetical protein